MDHREPIRSVALPCGAAILAMAVWIAGVAYGDVVDFRSGESPPLLAIRPATPTRLDVVSFTTPLNGLTYGNDCDAASSLGGRLTIIRDDFEHTIQIGHDGNPPDICPLIFDPVNGAEGSFGPLSPGGWILSDPYENLFEFTVAALCDLDAGGSCNTDDIDLMYSVGDIRLGVSIPPASPILDLNEDGDVTLLDRDAWLNSAAAENGFSSPYQLGDANLDGRVDVEDLNTLGLHWQQDGKVWSTADSTGDGRVDPSDLNYIGLNWQQAIPVAAAESVPEPAGRRLLVWASILCWWTRSKIRQRDLTR